MRALRNRAPSRAHGRNSRGFCEAERREIPHRVLSKNFPSSMNLLVTGGAGFIGSNLVHHIIDRPEIRLLANLDCLTYAGHLESLEDIGRHPKYMF